MEDNVRSMSATEAVDRMVMYAMADRRERRKRVRTLVSEVMRDTLGGGDAQIDGEYIRMTWRGKAVRLEIGLVDHELHSLSEKAWAINEALVQLRKLVGV